MAVHRPSRSPATIVAVVAAFLTLLPVGPAAACSCAFMEPTEALAARPAAAFVGALAEVAATDVDAVGQPARRWTFEVEAVLAGELAPTVDVLAAEDDGANCGLRAAPGERVGLLLHTTDTGWSSSSCSTFDADALLAAGDPYPPDPSLATAPDGGGAATATARSWLGLAAVAMAALGVLGATAVVVRRRR